MVASLRNNLLSHRAVHQSECCECTGNCGVGKSGAAPTRVGASKTETAEGVKPIDPNSQSNRRSSEHALGSRLENVARTKDPHDSVRGQILVGGTEQL